MAYQTIPAGRLSGTAGGQTLTGGTASGDSLTLTSTSNATKGKIYFGASSAYDEVNVRLGIGRTDPGVILEMYSTTAGLRPKVNCNVSGNASAMLDLYCGTGSGSNAAIYYYGQAGGKEWCTGYDLTADRFKVTYANNLPSSSTEIMSFSQNTITSTAGATCDRIRHPATTVVISGSTNITTAAGFNFKSISAPTYSAGSALTISDSATLYIGGAPIGGGAGPATLTRAYALWIDSGLFRYDGQVAVGGGSTATLGTIGGSGPTAAAMSGWLPINIDGNSRFIPVWA